MQADQQPTTYLLQETVPSVFHFESTALAHGWVKLRPFNWNEPSQELSRIYQLGSGQVVRLRLREGSNSVKIEVDAAEPLSPPEEAEIRRVVRRMLRLDENLDEFHQLYAQLDDWNLRLQPGAGRLLRCPTLFEDIVYTLCTTNINWSGTIRMVDRLTTSLGRPFPGQTEWCTFPTPAAITEAGVESLKNETGLGYRSPYVWELAAAVAKGQFDLSGFEDSERPADEVYQALRQIKGVGPYAAATIFMLLGRYEHLAVDSEMRAFVSRKYFDGEPVSNSQIQQIYAPWGRWRYLAYWFDSPA